jgi:hypothetical protein
MADVTFFTLVWPYDSARPSIWENGVDPWFCVQCIQAVFFTMLAKFAFRRLGITAEDTRQQALSIARSY